MHTPIKYVFFALSLLYGASANAGISDDTVKIGVLSDMSGLFSDLSGEGAVTAARMAMDDFVTNEKPDFKVELVTADHQNKTDVAASRAREWYDTQGVDMITDVINSAVALAVSEVTRDKDKVLMVTGSGSTAINNEQCSPNTVFYAWDTYSLANSLGHTLTDQGYKKWYFVTVDYALGKAIEYDATKAVQQAGGEVAGSLRHPMGASDFASFMLQAQSSGADVIGIANAGADLHNAIRVANEFGINQQQKIVGLSASMTDVHALGLATTQGMLLVEGFYWDQNEQARAWSRRFQEKTGKMPNMLNAATYSAITQYLSAVKRLGNDDASAVLADLHSREFNDLFARNGSLRPDGQMVHDVYLFQVKAPSESKGEWDYYKLLETIPAQQAYQPLSESRCPLVSEEKGT
ncbi:ABC transporter substrate-binding protein [Alloalcanivorax xenomutans]|uniref:ABC transporter substrate-binding protein n=1 Tax=Alloalcanivorax xenomutans TaxID=1094342 RepID=UPI00292CD824|nr:ABC transporter substrate-binding protein [Alloalcanivorax xenomutans]WOA30166.1 ABC transporter substrate-binding protein [Alloalcanivorax xenomutans]